MIRVHGQFPDEQFNAFVEDATQEVAILQTCIPNLEQLQPSLEKALVDQRIPVRVMLLYPSSPVAELRDEALRTVRDPAFAVDVKARLEIPIHGKVRPHARLGPGGRDGRDGRDGPHGRDGRDDMTHDLRPLGVSRQALAASRPTAATRRAITDTLELIADAVGRADADLRLLAFLRFWGEVLVPVEYGRLSDRLAARVTELLSRTGGVAGFKETEEQALRLKAGFYDQFLPASAPVTAV